jgi:hypothetical protein
MHEVPYRQIRAVFDDRTIRVYQAYSDAIADAALAAGTFIAPPFKMERMTWIKPSFLWMMYRSGWGTKPDQTRVLAIDMTRAGFEWALDHACLSHYEPGTYASQEAWEALKAKASVRIQWDPERDASLRQLEYRAIQIGLSGEAVRKYVTDWIVNIIDLTSYVKRVQLLTAQPHASEDIRNELPAEHVYPLPPTIARKLGMN